MTDIEAQGRRRGRRAARRAGAAAGPARTAAYRRLENPYTPVAVFSTDEIEAIHAAALQLLEGTGIRLLLADARQRFAAAGADVDEAEQRVRLDRGLVEQTLATAPGTIEVRAPAPERAVAIGGRHLAITPVGGPPHATDLDRGRRAGTLADYLDFVRLTQHFDVLHLQTPCVEPQDVPVHLRHYATMRGQLTLSDKVPWVYSRGAPQVADSFAMLRIVLGLTDEEFRARPHCFTVINTNSPLQLDVPMLQGLIDFAEAGQVAIVTPFTLAGAMAPVTLAGALTVQHAEAMAGITLTQIVQPGAPVIYGGFTSNVDMRSGAPAFGTPEYVKAAWATGQLARRIGLPWRSSGANASNAADAQSAYETQMSMWGAVMGGCNVLVHGAGWLEGGLSASFEKFILDIEMLQMFAELFRPTAVDAEEIGLDAIAAVGPAGHFFGSPHTMARYERAFYAPLVSDWSNFGQWTESGARTATERANAIWKRVLAAFEPPPLDPARREALDDFIARRTAEGGAPPES
jgi:trimethylamine--corrinoid protein Co-methyltransferase